LLRLGSFMISCQDRLRNDPRYVGLEQRCLSDDINRYFSHGWTARIVRNVHVTCGFSFGLSIIITRTICVGVLDVQRTIIIVEVTIYFYVICRSSARRLSLASPLNKLSLHLRAEFAGSRQTSRKSR